MMNHKFSNSLRRSALHIPATNQRAMAKAQSLPADVIIFDFEDAVAPWDKALARQTLCEQLGDANLLSGLLKKKVVYNFRENDLLNGGNGAPLAPIFHQLLINQNKIKLPACILNIGGISNLTLGYQSGFYNKGGTNVFIGQNSGLGLSNGTSTGSNNVAMGHSAMKGFTTANGNVALGVNAMMCVTTGCDKKSTSTPRRKSPKHN